MKDATVTAKIGQGEDVEAVSVSMKFPESVKEAVEVYGEAAVLSNALANFTITLQSAIRRYKRAGKSNEEIQSLVSAAKMGQALERVSDPKAAMTTKFKNMSEEERRAFIKELQHIAAGK